MASINRRRFITCTAAVIGGVAVGAAAQRAPGQAGGGGVGGGGNNNKKKKRKANPRVEFKVSGADTTRFYFQFTPSGGAGRVVALLMVWNEQAKAFVQGANLGTYSGAFKGTTAPATLREGRYAVEIAGGGMKFTVRVDAGTGTGDEASYRKIAEKSGTV